MKTRLNILLCGGCYYLYERPLSDEMRCEHSDAPEDNLVPPTGYTPEWCPKMNPPETGVVFTPSPSPAEVRAAKYPVKRVPEQLVDVLSDEAVEVRLVDVTYPPTMAVEEAYTVQPHDWSRWPGGPPSDLTYEWCRACGTLKVMTHGDPTEYHVPGERDPVGLEPSCKGTKP